MDEQEVFDILYEKCTESQGIFYSQALAIEMEGESLLVRNLDEDTVREVSLEDIELIGDELWSKSSTFGGRFKIC